jgi:hypothetical protein
MLHLRAQRQARAPGLVNRGVQQRRLALRGQKKKNRKEKKKKSNQFFGVFGFCHKQGSGA